MTDVDTSDVERRLGVVRDRIRAAGGDVDAVTILAVTKAKPVSAVRAAVAVGLLDVGENYAQELVAKYDEVAADPGAEVRWHMIGRLQSNKIRMLAGRVALWQSIDRPSLVTELAKRDPGAALLVQVDISDEPAKGGARPDAVGEIIDSAIAAGLDVRGLMGVAAAAPPDVVGRQMRLLRTLCDRHGLRQCSMGMSGDLEIAVREGATMVRIGSDLFGPR